MKSCIQFLLAILILCCQQISAQSTLGAYKFSAPDTVYNQSVDSFFVQIKNTGALMHNGPITINIRVNANPVITLDSVPMILPPNAIGIFGITTFSFDTLDLQPANNIVVVWPTGTGVTTSDSITANLYYVDNTGIRLQKEEREIKVFPNPATNKIHIVLPENLNKPNEITIVDLHGRQIYHSSVFPLEIETTNWASGFYILSIQFADNRTLRQKFCILSQ